MKLSARIDVLAGAFASQQLAFAHLLDAAQAADLSPDLDHIEVVQPPYLPRLRGYFDEATALDLSGAAGRNILILVLPGALVSGAFPEDQRLRRLGVYDGQIVRAM